MKIKVIDLLNKIANGEEPPKKIYYLEETFTYDEQSKDYYDSETYGLFDSYEIPPMLNDEVEILEITITMNNQDKKIEKLKDILIHIKESETILGGEYYIIHSDFIIALEEEIDKINELIEAYNER